MLLARTIAIVVTALAAHGGALALDAAEADRLVKRYLATQKTPDMDAQAQQQIVADLNGDGKPEIVLLWSLLGPTYWYTKLSVLVPAGKAAQASVADITGLAETLRVDGGAIVVDTLVLGKNDPRCCPSVKKQVRYRWSGTKLAPG
jgi:hypothetical protein